MKESNSGRKEPSNENRSNHVNEEREKVSRVNSSSNTEPGYSEKPQDLINSISALINTRLTEFRSEMITLINKNGDQPMSLGDRDSYYEDFETNNLPKAEKGKTGNTHFHDLSALFKNSAENNNHGPAVGQTGLFKSFEFGNGSRMSDKNHVILEFKYLKNKKMVETSCRKC